MDLVDLIITIAILAVGSLLTGGKKKKPQQQTASRQNGSPRRATAQTASPQGGSSVFGSFVDEDLVIRNSGNKNKSQRQRPASKKNQEYFSYENQPIDWNSESETMQESVEDNNTNEASTQMQDWFDLRQAVIYQTIMENKYILDMK